MEAANKIRDAVAHVSLLRQQAQHESGLLDAVGQVKRLQARRFAGSYADMMHAGPYASATRFFLDELYSDKDYAQRDAQFSRIAGAIEKFFPAQVGQTAVALAQLHCLTEDLDQSLAKAWLATDPAQPEAVRYAQAWRAAGRREERQAQLSSVLGIGEQMARLTRTPGLRLMLKMMRGPASAAGLGSLQRFLESGFDTFAAMARTREGAAAFLATIRARETALLDLLFDAPLVACETELTRVLGQAP